MTRTIRRVTLCIAAPIVALALTLDGMAMDASHAAPAPDRYVLPWWTTTAISGNIRHGFEWVTKDGTKMNLPPLRVSLRECESFDHHIEVVVCKRVQVTMYAGKVDERNMQTWIGRHN